MPQNDFLIENQSAPDFRADLNDALEALATLSSGIGPPSNTYPNMLWYDTINSTLKIRTEADDDWIVLFSIDQGRNRVEFPSLIAAPFPVFDNLGNLAPSNSGTPKFVKLTAGQTGAGQYNEGLLTNESVIGSYPGVIATAQIATGSLAGSTIPLINTEQSFLRPGTGAMAFQQDSMQNITGQMRAFITGASGANGAFQYINQGADRRAPGEGGTEGIFDFNAARVVRTSGETRPKNRAATYYMRIV